MKRVHQSLPTDISSTKQTHRIERLFEISSDLMCVLSTNGLFEKVNRAFVKTLGYTEKNLEKLSLVDVVHQDDVDNTLAALQRVQQGEPMIEFENRCRRKSGTYISLSWNMCVDESDPHVIYATARDISRLKDLETKLRAEIEESHSFIKMASHDLQEPVRTISSFTNFLCEDLPEEALTEEVKEYLDYIMIASSRLRRQIEATFDYGNIHKQAVAWAKVSIPQTIETIQSKMSSMLREKNATIKWSGDVVEISACKNLFEKMLHQLIENGMKFNSSSSPLVEILTRNYDVHHILLQAVDNGIGIEEKYFERVMMPFKKLHSEDEYPGTGIGLSTVKKIVKKHGWTLQLESTLGKGTTISVLIPKNG
ncbi:MAG: PAS domain S-box protein [Bdellovibrionota bacterium]